MSYPLRLPVELDAAARERCASLGISLNALIAVALDAYLRADERKSGRRPAATKRGAKAAVGKPSIQPFEAYHPDPDNFRNFHNPDMWPYVDDEWESGLEEPDEWDIDHPDWKKYQAEVDKRYWATHDRPKPR